MVNNKLINSDWFTNPELLLQAIAEDRSGKKGRPSTNVTHFSYEHFDEYFAYLCMQKLVAESYKLGKDGWCYSGYNYVKDHYKIYFVKYMDNGYEALEFLVSQFEFDAFYPSTYPTVIPLILRTDKSYILGNTINECIYRVVYTDDRGFDIDNVGMTYRTHFQITEFEDDDWYKIIGSNDYKILEDI